MLIYSASNKFHIPCKIHTDEVEVEKSRGWNKIHRVLQTIVDENANVANRASIGLRELLADSKAATV